MAFRSLLLDHQNKRRYITAIIREIRAGQETFDKEFLNDLADEIEHLWKLQDNPQNRGIQSW